jgi:hypothetical protein
MGTIVKYKFGDNWCVVLYYLGEHISVVVWGTMLRTGRSQVRFPMRSSDFFNWLNPTSCIIALGLTQPLTEMGTRNLPGGKGQLASKAYNLTTICEPIV